MLKETVQRDFRPIIFSSFERVNIFSILVKDFAELFRILSTKKLTPPGVSAQKSYRENDHYDAEITVGGTGGRRGCNNYSIVQFIWAAYDKLGRTNDNYAPSPPAPPPLDCVGRQVSGAGPGHLYVLSQIFSQKTAKYKIFKLSFTKMSQSNFAKNFVSKKKLSLFSPLPTGS